jgi:arylsulfatase A-like enzyme/Tfp pilus assembly protein PilF
MPRRRRERTRNDHERQRPDLSPIGWMTGVAFVLALGVLAWWWLRPPSITIERRADRNVLLVTIDTLRGDALRSYGGAADTPNLDRLAASGARFTFAHAHAVLTLPSHGSILTGRYPYEHGLRDNSGFRLRRGEATIATRLKALGFSAGAFVSAYPLDQRYGLNTGFDVYDDHVSEVGRTLEIALPERRADATVGLALDWIGRQSGKWFAWVHVFDPHAPYKAPAEWQAKYPSNAYAAEVAWTDASLGRLFDALDRQSRPTLVIVTADHGEGLGDHGELTHGVFAYESTLHVPLIVADAGPGHAQVQGTVISSPARHVDLLPTVLESIAAPLPGDLPGRSLLDDVARGGGADRPSYFESMMPVLARGWAPLRGVLVAREKYIDLPISELYDLADDVSEQRNVATIRQDRTTVLMGVLKGFNLAPPDRPAEEVVGVRERLRALGYTGGSPAPPREKYTENDDPKRLIELDQMLHRGRELFQANRPADAIAIFKQIIARRPDMADAYRQLAFVLWQMGQPGPAIGTLEAAVRNGIAQRDLQVTLGNYLAEAGAAPKAAALLESLPQDDPETLNALGIAYAHLNRPADAMRVFRRALEIDETNGLAYQNIGTVHLQSGDLAGAEKALREALRIDPTLAGAHTTLGVVLARTKRGAEAVESWKRAVDLEPADFDALYNLTLELINQGRMDEARQFGDRYIASAPPSLHAPDIAHLRKLLGRE